MATKKKMLEAAAGAAGGASLDITDVFSTYLYTGNASTQTVTNGIDLSGEGGLVWIKNRSAASTNHSIFDTESGATGGTRLRTNLADGLQTFNGSAVFTTSSTGFALNNDASNDLNDSLYDYASWTFRKAPKFFDVVTWTGNAVSGRQIAHNLGTTVGSIFVKQLTGANNWMVYHRGANGGTNAEDYNLYLNLTNANEANAMWADTAPTDTHFTVGGGAAVNGANNTYVAYIFAHNDSGDGEFGPDGDQDIIKCGSYTGNGSATGPVIDLGFEPQWLLVKRSDAGTDQWLMLDTMRGWPSGGTVKRLWANGSDSEGSAAWASMYLSATGFQPAATDSTINTNGATYIYMAIRRGPLAPPEAGTEVFAMDTRASSGTNVEPAYRSPFPVDMAIVDRVINVTSINRNVARLMGGVYLRTNGAEAEGAYTTVAFDNMNGISDAAFSSPDTNRQSYMWKRAPGFFDVVAWTGVAGTAQTINHNLGVVPEMIWTKRRNATSGWIVYNKTITATNWLALHDDRASGALSTAWNNTEPTASSFTAGQTVSATGAPVIAYLFATLAGVSKVGSVTHSGTTNVDCGFSAGARFVMLKRTDATGDWYVWDSVRGIIAGNDPYLLLNTTAAQVTNTDYIDPLSSGFTITSTFTAGDYIFYAIA